MMLFYVKFLWVHVHWSLAMLIVLQRCQFEHTCKVASPWALLCSTKADNQEKPTLTAPLLYLNLGPHILYTQPSHVSCGWVGLQSNQWFLMYCTPARCGKFGLDPPPWFSELCENSHLDGLGCNIQLDIIQIKLTHTPCEKVGVCAWDLYINLISFCPVPWLNVKVRDMDV